MSKINVLKVTLHWVVFILTISFVPTDASNYCELQKSCLNNEKHVGCEKNNFKMPLLQNVVPEKMTNELREYILNLVNKFRNGIAMGDFKGFGQASDMQSLRWNYEFEYLTGLSIQKLPFGELQGCFETEKFANPWEFHSIRIGNYTAKSLISSIMEQFFNNSLTNVKEWSGVYASETSDIGCSFAKQIITKEKSQPFDYIMKCYFNKKSIPTVKEAYNEGEPCSKCGTWNKICSNNKYPGLCFPSEIPINEKYVPLNESYVGPKGEPGIAGPPGLIGLTGPVGKMGKKGEVGVNGLNGMQGIKGDRGVVGEKGSHGLFGLPGVDGEKGIKGDRGFDGSPGLHGLIGERGNDGNDCNCNKEEIPLSPTICEFQYPTSFWVLYIILTLTVIFSFTLSLEVLRNSYKKVNPFLISQPMSSMDYVQINN